MNHWPPWVILHIPHDSTLVPDAVRAQFALDDADLAAELVHMTDHHTHALFATGVPAQQVVRAPVSRLVVDVERFADDAQEPMSLRGMGAVYLQTHDRRPLRHAITAAQRQALLDTWYHPHHAALAAATQHALGQHACALVIDAHSFPSIALPYEADQALERPEICIGTDAFHTPQALADLLVAAFRAAGFTVGLNTPFAGALVPSAHYQKDRRVSAAMVEVRRDLYLDEGNGLPLARFAQLAQTVRNCIASATQAWQEERQGPHG